MLKAKVMIFLKKHSRWQTLEIPAGSTTLVILQLITAFDAGLVCLSHLRTKYSCNIHLDAICFSIYRAVSMQEEGIFKRMFSPPGLRCIVCLSWPRCKHLNIATWFAIIYALEFCGWFVHDTNTMLNSCSFPDVNFIYTVFQEWHYPHLQVRIIVIHTHLLLLF